MKNDSNEITPAGKSSKRKQNIRLICAVVAAAVIVIILAITLPAGLTRRRKKSGATVAQRVMCRVLQ